MIANHVTLATERRTSSTQVTSSFHPLVAMLPAGDWDLQPHLQISAASSLNSHKSEPGAACLRNLQLQNTVTCSNITHTCRSGNPHIMLQAHANFQAACVRGLVPLVQGSWAIITSRNLPFTTPDADQYIITWHHTSRWINDQEVISHTALRHKAATMYFSKTLHAFRAVLGSQRG